MPGIENLILVKKSKLDGFLEFETLTLVPIDKNLIDFAMLNEDEVNWLDNYHKKIYNETKNNLEDKYCNFLKKFLTN